jgi:spore maturation protein CgeB
MKIVLFCHSLVSDWNHGNAHFLRGICRELQARGHQVVAYEPHDGWSRTHLSREHGPLAELEVRRVYPELVSRRYDLRRLDLDRALDGADLVIVHEWSPAELVRRLGEHRRRSRSYRLLFHDTHHRSMTDPASMAAYDLSCYDGVLAFGEAVREIYLERGLAERVWTWHEAADTTVFRPLRASISEGDVVWVGNWGDGERSAELEDLLLEPVRQLRLRARLYGVRYPEEALAAIARAGAEYGGWLPNFRVPEIFGRYRFTVHVPRRPYVESLPGIPTIRVFEALACGVPLLCSRWHDCEGLFLAGRDYLVAEDGETMRRWMVTLIGDPALGHEVARNGRRTILSRHTCRHRVEELLDIYEQCRGPGVLPPREDSAAGVVEMAR